MAKFFRCWVIVDGVIPTSFRAREAEALVPTLKQLQRTQPDVRLQWFERGRLWDSPEAAQAALSERRRAPEARGRGWRPGGEHKDPRARPEIPRDAKRALYKKRLIAQKTGQGGPTSTDRGGSRPPSGERSWSRPAPPRPDAPRPAPPRAGQSSRPPGSSGFKSGRAKPPSGRPPSGHSRPPSGGSFRGPGRPPVPGGSRERRPAGGGSKPSGSGHRPSRPGGAAPRSRRPGPTSGRTPKKRNDK